MLAAQTAADSTRYFAFFRLLSRGVEDAFDLALKPRGCRCDARSLSVAFGPNQRCMKIVQSPVLHHIPHPCREACLNPSSIIASISIGDNRDAIVPTRLYPPFLNHSPASLGLIMWCAPHESASANTPTRFLAYARCESHWFDDDRKMMAPARAASAWRSMKGQCRDSVSDDTI